MATITGTSAVTSPTAPIAAEVVMRGWISGCVLACLALGCHHLGRGRSDRFGPCEPSAGRCPPAAECNAPAAPRPPSETRVTIPPPKVVIEVPETTVVRAPECATPQAAAPCPALPTAAAGPTQWVVGQTQGATLQAVPQAAVGVPQMSAAIQSAPGFPHAAAYAEQTVTPPRTRLGITLDTVRIPFPVIRFVPVTRPGEVTTTTQFAAPPPVFTQAAVQAVPVSSHVVSQAVLAQPQVVSQAVVAQPQFVQPQYVAAQPQVVAASPQLVVQPPQVVAQPQVVGVQQAPPVVHIQQAPPQVGAQTVECPPVSRQTLDALQQELDRARGLLNSQPRRP